MGSAALPHRRPRAVARRRTGWRNGTLMVGIVDKSGFRQGTSLGGNLLTGFTRTIADVLSNHVEDSYDLFTGETIDETG